MEIETLQIKRVTGNWDNHKGYKPLLGEYVLVDIQGKTKTLIMGNGSDTLESIFENAECVIPFKNYVDETKTTLDGKITNLKPASSSTPLDITKDSSSMGNAPTFAPSDHTHTITKETITDVLANGEFIYRGIQIGTLDPTESNITGEKGDIYIRYEETSV
jgi:hypothetical protein